MYVGTLEKFQNFLFIGSSDSYFTTMSPPLNTCTLYWYNPRYICSLMVDFTIILSRHYKRSVSKIVKLKDLRYTFLVCSPRIVSNILRLIGYNSIKVSINYIAVVI